MEFTTEAVSLLDVIDVKLNLEEELHISVDVLHAPVPEKSMLIIKKAVSVYERA